MGSIPMNAEYTLLVEEEPSEVEVFSTETNH